MILYIANSINYLSWEGLPWIISAWIGLVLFRSFATFIHEIGHLIAAYFLTKDDLLIRVGNNNKSWKINSGRIYWELSFFSGREGFTGYQTKNLSPIRLFTIIAMGPIASLLMGTISGWVIFSIIVPTWLEIIMVSWFCANSLAFFRSIIPVSLKPTKNFPEGPPSDGLELMRILRGKNR
ncbi:MAG: M50 family metallopeptidase [Opitutales bacterium]|nr:M50 family metallopeptidase [Opitutales bacterium]